MAATGAEDETTPRRLAPTTAARRARIVATLGPASDGHEAELVAAGLDVARLNFSHGTHADHQQRCQAIRAAAAQGGRVVAVLQDLQGPKIRVGRLVGGGPVLLDVGADLTITTRDVLGTASCVSCTYDGLPRDVQAGDQLLLDDGRIRLRVQGVEEQDVRTRVEEGGPLGEHKGINLPGIAVSAPALTDKDREDLRFGLQELHVDLVALSFIRTADEVREAREVARAAGGDDVPLIVKLEKGEAIQHLEAILGAADGVMVARGDLGVELPPEQVPMLQKRIIRRANQRGLPVITATQMLESMVSEEVPTRAEASDIANAIWDGTDAVMLSEETAAGQHPVLALRMMDRIVRAAESADRADAGGLPAGRREEGAGHRRGYAAAIARAAAHLVEELSASAVVGITRTGHTAELLSGTRLDAPIYAFTPDEQVSRRLALWWGVNPVHQPIERSLEANIQAMQRYLLDHGLAREGDMVVIVGSHPFQPGVHTNFVRYQVLGRP